MADEKYTVTTTGPQAITLPSAEGWPRDKDGNPLEITVRNLGSERVTVQQSTGGVIVYPTEEKTFKFQ